MDRNGEFVQRLRGKIGVFDVSLFSQSKYIGIGFWKLLRCCSECERKDSGSLGDSALLWNPSLSSGSVNRRLVTFFPDSCQALRGNGRKGSLRWPAFSSQETG